MECKHLSESEVKQLCEMARDILAEETRSWLLRGAKHHVSCSNPLWHGTMWHGSDGFRNLSGRELSLETGCWTVNH